MDEQSLLENDDVYTCSECGKYFADNLNGKYLSDCVPKWYCFECIKRMNDSHLKPFIEMSVYTQRKNMLDLQHKELSVTPPMTPPSSDDENSKNAKMHKNPSIKPKNYLQFSRKHSRSPDKRKRGNFYRSPNKKHVKTKYKNGKQQNQPKTEKIIKIRRNSLKQNKNNEQKRRLPEKSHTTMTSVPVPIPTTTSNPALTSTQNQPKAKSVSPTKIRIPDGEPLPISKSRSVELPTEKETEKDHHKKFKSESPELVIQDIIDTEFSDITFLGPQTPSSPSLTDKEFGHKLVTKTSASDKDVEDNENEEDDDSNSDEENPKAIATVSVATQVTDKNIADKATQATQVTASSTRKKIYTPRDVVKIEATTPSTTVSSTESSNISSPSPDNEEENENSKEIKKQNVKRHTLKGSQFGRTKPRHHKYKHTVNGNKYKDKYLNNIPLEHNHHSHHYYHNPHNSLMYNPYNTHHQHHHQNNILNNSWNAYYGQTQPRDHQHHHGVFMMNNYVHSHHHHHRNNHNHNKLNDNNHTQQQQNRNNNATINGYQTYQCTQNYHSTNSNHI